MDKEMQEAGRFYTIIVDFFANYSLQILGAAIILLIGIKLSTYVQKAVLRVLLKNNIDETFSEFAANFVRILVVVMVVVLALGKLGISVAPFIAAIGALSLTAGLALQGAVGNFAAGVVLVVTKPFKVGDTLTVKGIYGEVQEIKLSYTLLLNEDKEQITIPNKYMIGDILVNSFAYRIVEGDVGIAYDADIVKAVEAIKEVICNNKKVNVAQEPIVGVAKFGESVIEIGYRYWVPTKSFYKTQFEINLHILDALKNCKIAIPFPQREIHIKGDK